MGCSGARDPFSSPGGTEMLTTGGVSAAAGAAPSASAASAVANASPSFRVPDAGDDI